MHPEIPARRLWSRGKKYHARQTPIFENLRGHRSRSGHRPVPALFFRNARARLARYKAPKYVFFVDEFPLTASGKVQKYKLRAQAKELLGIEDGVFSGEGDGAKAEHR